MPRDVNGAMTLVSGNPVVAGTTISADVHNATLADIRAEIEDSLSRSGKGGMTGQFKHANGTVLNPAITFTDDTDTGIYRAGSADVRVAIDGADVAKLTPTGIGSESGAFIATGAVSATVTGNVADGATAVAVVLDNANALADAGAKALSVRVAGVEKLGVSGAGRLGSLANLPLANKVESASSVSFLLDNTTTYTDVTNLSVTLTATGRPVLLVVQPADTGESFMGVVSGTETANVRLMEDSAQVGEFVVDAVVPGNLFVVHVPAAGEHTYKLQAKSGASSSVGVYGCKLVAIEL